MVRVSNSRGSALIEAAFAIPIIFVLFLALIDVCHYLFVRNVLSEAAQSGLTRASYEPDIESLDTSKFDRAVESIADFTLSRATSMLGEGSGSRLALMNSEATQIVQIPPAPNPGSNDRTAALRANPIRVRLVYEIPVFVSFGAQQIPLDIAAVGFREQFSGNSLPVATDCQGNPYVPGLPFSSCSNGCTPSSCGPNGVVLDPLACSCECRAPFIPAGTGCTCPGCPTGQALLDQSNCVCGTCPAPKILSGNSCVCPDSTVVCPIGSYFSQDSCACVPTGCTTRCDGNLVPSGPNCVCGCPGGIQQIDNQCVCPAGQVFDGRMCRCPACTVPDDKGRCVSQGSAPNCTGGMVLVNCTQCVCPPGRCNVYDDNSNLVGCGNCDG